MCDSATIPEVFKYGSSWLRADFHLHTRADKEFIYTGEDDRYTAEYVTGLKVAGIRVGVITNHNKFDKDEFKTLRKRARKEEIFLLFMPVRLWTTKFLYRLVALTTPTPKRPS